jgi:hypothetical protein
MLNNVILGWLLRRAMEIGGLVGTAALTAFGIWNSLPPGAQDAFMSLLSRNWEGVTLGDLWPLAVAIWGYAWSFRSTVKDQVVSNGKQVPLDAVVDELPTAVTKGAVEQKVETVARRKSGILDGFLKSVFGKR